MKSFLIWLSATLLGVALGFGLSWLTGMSVYLCVGIGTILGSSAGVTANIQRGRETIEFESDAVIAATENDSEHPAKR